MCYYYIMLPILSNQLNHEPFKHAHFLGLVHEVGGKDYIVLPWDEVAREIQEMYEGTTGKYIITHTMRDQFFRYGTMWIITRTTEDSMFFQLKYKHLINVTTTKREFMLSMELHRTTTSFSEQSVLTAMAEQYTRQKREKQDGALIAAKLRRGGK